MSAVDGYAAHLGRLNRRPGTIRQRRWGLGRLERFLAPGELLGATLEDLRAFVERGELSAETRASEVSAVRSFYRWARDEGLVDVNVERLERPVRPRRLPRPMGDEAAAFALHNAPEPMRTWFYLAAYAGLRSCEIGPLRGEDVRAEVLVIREQKGGDAATVPLSPILRTVLAPYPRSGWLFPHRGPGAPGPTSAGQVQRRANRWLHDAGIEETMHTLRHWFGTHVYRASGRDLRLTQELMRHQSPVSTALYTALDPDDGIRTLALLPAL